MILIYQVGSTTNSKINQKQSDLGIYTKTPQIIVKLMF